MDPVTKLITKLMVHYLDKLEARNSHQHQEALKMLSETGSPSIPALIAALKAPDAKLRASAADALGQIMEPHVVPALITALQDKDSHVRQEAAKSLGKLQDSHAVPALIAALKDNNRHVRTFAAVALGKLHDPRAVPALITTLIDMESFSVPQMGAWALGEIASHDPTPALRDALPALRRLRYSVPVYRETLMKIEAATADMKNLPLPSSAPLPDATSLPRPSAVPTTLPDALPIPSAPRGDNTSDCHSQDPITRSRW